MSFLSCKTLSPYLECITSPMTVQKKYRGCTKSECRAYHVPTSASFCKLCGTQITDFFEENKVSAVRSAVSTTSCSWDYIIPFESLWAEYKRITQLQEKLNQEMVCLNVIGLSSKSTDPNKIDHYWIGNIRAKGYLSVNLRESDDAIFNLSTLDISSECSAFAKQYEKEIEILKTAYGAENVHLRWGILCYTN